MPLSNEALQCGHLRCSHFRTELGSQVFMDLLGQVLQFAKGERSCNWIMSNTQLQMQPRTLTHLWPTLTSVDRATHSLPHADLYKLTLKIKGLKVCQMLSFHTDKCDATCSASSHPILTSKHPLPSRSPAHHHLVLLVHLHVTLQAAQPGSPQ